MHNFYSPDRRVGFIYIQSTYYDRGKMVAEGILYQRKGMDVHDRMCCTGERC
jgi:hypothetical protein